MKKLNGYFESNVAISRINVGNKQTIEALINEEALLFASTLDLNGILGYLEDAISKNK